MNSTAACSSAAVAELLAKYAEVHAKGGPFDWEPLLYAAYSRLDSEAEGHSTLQAARLLLDARADPNAGFLWEGGYLFTVLTGVLGLGEDDVFRTQGPLWQPPHQHWVEFARLLLREAAVVVSPGSMYGPSGEGFFRISLTTPDDRLVEAVERLGRLAA